MFTPGFGDFFLQIHSWMLVQFIIHLVLDLDATTQSCHISMQLVSDFEKGDVLESTRFASEVVRLFPDVQGKLTVNNFKQGSYTELWFSACQES